MNKFQQALLLQFSTSIRTLISNIFFLSAVLSTPLSVSAQLTWQPTNGPEGGATWYIWNNEQYAFYPITQQPQLLVSPNPASVFCRVNSDELISGPADIVVTDISGKVCLTQFASDINKGITISVANLSDGSYTIMAVSQSGSLSGKLQVAH